MLTLLLYLCGISSVITWIDPTNVITMKTQRKEKNACVNGIKQLVSGHVFKLRCDERFTHAFSAFSCGSKVISLVGSNQGNYF